MTEDLEIHIIELPKIKELTQQESKEELVKWLNFIEGLESGKVVQSLFLIIYIKYIFIILF